MFRRASVTALVMTLAVAACGPRPVTVERTRAPDIVVVPTELANGRIEIAIQPRYLLGSTTRIDIAIVATRGTIAGPTEARVMASATGEGGTPPEVLVKRIGTTRVTATAGGRATTSITWDGRDEFGARVPADAYVLLLEFEADDGAGIRKVRATATLQMND